LFYQALLANGAEPGLTHERGDFMKRRLLLVDDDVAVLLTLKTVLEMHGFEIETAASVADAAAKLQASTFHMVISDMRMETENAGEQVMKIARAQKYRPATAILTAYPPIETDWQNSGAQSLLVKPVGTKDLLRQIEALLIRQEDEKQRLNSALEGLPAADITAEQKRTRKAS
jgi:DNA-binding NtrC family response regulator